MWLFSQIKDAFKRCYGLQDFMKSNRSEGIINLNQQTGIRTTFLEDNYDTIINL